eukprot:1499391-Pyramimonas_sp.AAC.1
MGSPPTSLLNFRQRPAAYSCVPRRSCVPRGIRRQIARVQALGGVATLRSQVLVVEGPHLGVACHSALLE